MTYAFPPPPPMSISVVEFVVHLLVMGFLLSASFGIVPPCNQMPAKSQRRRLMLVGAVLAVFGAISVKEVRGCFAAFEICLATFTIARLLFRVFHWRFSLGCGCGALILGIVLSFLLVINNAYKRWRDSLWERRPACMNNVRNLGLAMQNWASGREGRIPDPVSSGAGDPPRSWRVAILPLTDRGDLESSYSVTEAWDADANQRIARTKVHIFWCEANRFPADESGRFYTNHAALTGPKTAFPGGQGMTLDAISRADGLSHTILIGECSGLNIVWTEPRDIDVSKQKIGINLPGDRPRHSSSILSSYHPRGAHVAFADGRVKFLSKRIDPNVLQALTTATGGEAVADEDQR